MGGFHLWRSSHDPVQEDGRRDAAERCFRQQGFSLFEPLSLSGWNGFHVAPVHGGPACFLRRGDDFVAVAGTLVFDGKIGTPALDALLTAFRFPFADWDRIAGQFALLIRKEGANFLLTDYFGVFQLFHDPDRTLFSTSFLAAAHSLDRLTFHPQGVYEFVLNDFPAGDDTVVDQLKRLGPDRQLRVGETVSEVACSKPLPTQISQLPLEERITDHADRLRSLTAVYVEQFGNRIQCPLSGGLDSRLALALLRDAGARPHVYVYGEKGEPDVDVPRAIARAEGFDLEVFDKNTFAAPDPDEFPAIVARNFHETDALVVNGGLFDNGGNAHARHARQIGGQLAVSGGCGEVLRNFFYLPDRPLRARDVAAAFFAPILSRDVTERFDAGAFVNALERKALDALERPGDRGRLPRAMIEQLYPRMRCRAFFGREISLVGRHGAYFMPFLDHKLAEHAVRIPLPLKNAGRFESALLAHIDPALAGHGSAYGYPLDRPPSMAHRFSEFSTRARPVWLRRRSYALRRRLGRVVDEHGGLLSPAYLGRVIDLEYPAMRRYFDVDRVADPGRIRRIATLEYLATHLGSRLVQA